MQLGSEESPSEIEPRTEGKLPVTQRETEHGTEALPESKESQPDTMEAETEETHPGSEVKYPGGTQADAGEVWSRTEDTHPRTAVATKKTQKPTRVVGDCLTSKQSSGVIVVGAKGTASTSSLLSAEVDKPKEEY